MLLADQSLNITEAVIAEIDAGAGESRPGRRAGGGDPASPGRDETDGGK